MLDLKALTRARIADLQQEIRDCRPGDHEYTYADTLRARRDELNDLLHLLEAA